MPLEQQEFTDQDAQSHHNEGSLGLNCSRGAKLCLWGKSVWRVSLGWLGRCSTERNSEQCLESHRQGCAPAEAGNSSGNNSITRALISFRKILNSFAWLREATSAFQPVPFPGALQKAESKTAPKELFETQQDVKCCLYKNLVLSLQQNSTCPDKAPGSRLQWGFFIDQKVKHTGGGFWVWCTGRAINSCWSCAMWVITTPF